MPQAKALSSAAGSTAAGSARRGASGPGWRLRLEVAVWRHGLIWPACAALLLLALGLETLQVRPLRQQQAGLAQQAQRAQSTISMPSAPYTVRAAAALNAAPDTVPAGTLKSWSDLLGKPGTDAALAQIFGLAQRHGIDLAQAQYQSTVQAPAGTRRLQITLPSHASYAQARGFVDALLLALPQASIDLLELKRYQRSEAELALTLKLSLWQLTQPLPGVIANAGATDATTVAATTGASAGASAGAHARNSTDAASGASAGASASTSASTSAIASSNARASRQASPSGARP